MNVFGVGPAELILILVVALIFVGPERLPRMAADIARTIREIRKYTAGFAAEFNDVIKEFEKETESERADWKEIGEGLTSATKDLSAEVASADSAAKGNTPAEIKPVAPATNGASSGASAPKPEADAEPVEKTS